MVPEVIDYEPVEAEKWDKQYLAYPLLNFNTFLTKMSRYENNEIS